jgi:hypothetical protein|tara:strand:- start:1245 stop:1391 length:147 start_codon:yes stop_codon:yes gene_type:complete
MGSARTGSNPVGVVFAVYEIIVHYCAVKVSFINISQRDSMAERSKAPA